MGLMSSPGSSGDVQQFGLGESGGGQVYAGLPLGLGLLIRQVKSPVFPNRRAGQARRLTRGQSSQKPAPEASPIPCTSSVLQSPPLTAAEPVPETGVYGGLQGNL